MSDELFNELLSGIKEVLGELKESTKEIQKDIGDIKITQAEQHITLVDHTKRSTANEEEIRLAKKHFDDRIKPIEQDRWKVKGVIAFIGLGFIILSMLALLHRI
jgi:hypothetical protein